MHGDRRGAWDDVMIFRFEDCSLDSERRELRRDGTLRPIEPQVFDLLEHLLRNRTRVVSKDDLIDAVWRGRAISDAALSTRINAARKAIGDDGAAQRLVRTLRGQGLRFVGTVEEDQAEPRWRADNPAGHRPPTVISGAPSLLVLPFANIGGERWTEEFADGLTDEVITAVTGLAWCFVSSAHASFARKNSRLGLREIAREQSVRYVIDGSVRCAADCVRISVRLIDAATDHHLWVERYDYRDADATDRFRVQEDVGRKILSAIGDCIYSAEAARARLKSAGSFGVWPHIVAALSLINTREKRNVRAAHDLLRKAIAIDPQSARAHGLDSFVTTLAVHLGWESRHEAVPLAVDKAGKALSIDGEEPWAHVARGYATMWLSPHDAVPHFENALALDPDLAIAHYLIALACTRAGEPGGVFAHAELGTKLSHRDLLSYGNRGVFNNVRATSSFLMGRHHDGIRFARAAIAESAKLAPAYRQLVVNCALAGEKEEASAALERLRQLSPRISLQWVKDDRQWERREDMRKYTEAFRMAGLS